MSAAQKPESTAVARTKTALPPEIQARVEENRMRNAAVAAIRGTAWGKDLTPESVRAVAQYAHENNIDPVRHVEVLGGRIYLTAELYQERGAALIQSGVIQPLEPEMISADPRLEQMAKDGDEWAIGESTRRIRQRIKYGVPEKATAAWVTRIHVTATGAVVEGVNWCGGGSRQRDPVGDAEPTKTALTRSWRRCWKQITEIVPTFAAQIAPIEASAKLVTAEVAEVIARQPAQLPAPRTTGPGSVPMAGQHTGFAYESTGETRRPAVQTVTRSGPPQVSQDVLDEHLGQPDPYAEDTETMDLALDDQRVEPKAGNAQEL